MPKEKLVVDNKIIITGDIETRNPKQKVSLRTPFGISHTSVNNNKFRLELEDDQPLTLNFSIFSSLGFSIFAKPGDSIHVEFNEIDLMNEMGPPVFSGSRVVENNYLFELNQIAKYKSSSYNYFYHCSETEFLNKIDSLNHFGKNIITRYKSQLDSDLEAVKSMEDFLKYNLAYILESYHSTLKFRFKKEVEAKGERFLSYEEDLLLDNSYLLKNSAYSTFLNLKLYNEFKNQVSVEGKETKKERWEDITTKEKFEFIDLAFENKMEREHLKFCFLYTRIHTTGVISETDIKSFEQTIPSPRYLTTLNGDFLKMPETLREKGILPNYTFLDRNDKEERLYNFRGKILYIDLWATWCAACLMERKPFEKLIEDFAGYQNDIEFIGISLDKEFEKEKWKNLIEREDFRGIQLIAKNAFDSQICKDLKVNSISRFIIVGRDGKLIQSKAPRPSQKGIRKILMDLISES